MNSSRLLQAKFNPTNRIGLFYFNHHDKSWSRLRNITNEHFVLETPDANVVRWTKSPLDAAYFADKPFDVKQKYGCYVPF